MITVETIEKLAALSRLTLTSEEKEKMCGEFDAILEYIETLSKISGNTAKGARSIVAAVNVMREDAPPTGGPHESGIHTETLLSAAPRREGNYIKVKKIL